MLFLTDNFKCRPPTLYRRRLTLFGYIIYEIFGLCSSGALSPEFLILGLILGFRRLSAGTTAFFWELYLLYGIGIIYGVGEMIFEWRWLLLHVGGGWWLGCRCFGLVFARG